MNTNTQSTETSIKCHVSLWIPTPLFSHWKTRIWAHTKMLEFNRYLYRSFTLPSAWSLFRFHSRNIFQSCFQLMFVTNWNSREHHNWLKILCWGVGSWQQTMMSVIRIVEPWITSRQTKWHHINASINRRHRYIPIERRMGVRDRNRKWLNAFYC